MQQVLFLLQLASQPGPVQPSPAQPTWRSFAWPSPARVAPFVSPVFSGPATPSPAGPAWAWPGPIPGLAWPPTHPSQQSSARSPARPADQPCLARPGPAHAQPREAGPRSGARQGQAEPLVGRVGLGCAASLGEAGSGQARAVHGWPKPCRAGSGLGQAGPNCAAPSQARRGNTGAGKGRALLCYAHSNPQESP